MGLKLDPPANANYAATVLRIPAMLDLPGLDNLRGVPTFGCQALVSKDHEVGELVVAFTAEVQLSEEYARSNNLFRDPTLNADPEQKGFVESNRRIRAIKLRGHRSDALLMPLKSLSYTGVDISQLKEGDAFDALNGHEISRKYVIPMKPGSTAGKAKIERAFRRVTDKQFPMHIETDNYWRCKHLLRPDREAVVTAKLHGSSGRWGVVPALRQKGRVERFINRWIKTPDYEHMAIAGSRKVIKEGLTGQNDYYGFDLWNWYAKRLEGLIPEGTILYGELIGYLPDTDTPIQKGYTYNLPVGQCELLVYRVAMINSHGVLADLSWDGVREFCQARGLKWVPEIARVSVADLDDVVDSLMDLRFLEDLDSTTDPCLPLSNKGTVDEGVVVRQEGIVPVLLKAKSGQFLSYETKQLDTGEADLESVA